MSDTTSGGAQTRRGDGVIVDRGTAGAGTLTRPVPSAPEPAARQARVPRQGRTRADREGALPGSGRVPRQRVTRPARPAPSTKEQPQPGRSQAPRSQAPRFQTVQAAQTAQPKTARSTAARTQAARPQTVRRPAARPQPERAPATAPAPAGIRAGLPGVSPAAANRMPFIVLLCGLLGGALASALVISTTLAEGSFQITKLQTADGTLARQRQQLQDEVAQAQSAPVIQQRAYELGMRPVSQLQFVNLKSGKVESDSGSPGGAPGYAP